MASFSSEIIGRNVVDLEGAMFGVVTDLRMTATTGLLTHVLVQHTSEIDPERLPWSTRNGIVEVPVDEVERIANLVHLRR
ncbi:MAG TPA: hypothetical protein HA286_05700, partial [Candidatus Poseidoniaceae archaeon]